MSDHNEDYLESNIVDSTFSGLGVNFILYYDRDGNLVYGKGYDYMDEAEIQIPDLGFLFTPPPESDSEALEFIRSGFYTLEDGSILQITLYPILKSDESGVPGGYLVMAAFVDEEMISEIGDRISLPFSIYSADDTTAFEGLRIDGISGEEDVITISGNGDLVTVISVIDDITGKPSYILRLDMPRVYYSTGMAAITEFTWIYLFCSLFIIAIVLWLVRRVLLSRIDHISNEIIEIGDSREFSRRIDITGDDELSMLAGTFNRMLDSLEDALVNEKKAMASAKVANEKLSLLAGITRHDILNKIIVLESYSDLLGSRLPEDPEMKDYNSKIKEAAQAISEQIKFTRDYEDLGTDLSQWQRVAEVAERAKPGCISRDVNVIIDTGVLEIFADPMLEKVFFNLFDNSFRHGGHVTEIRVTCDEDPESGGDMVIAVEDNGGGVPEYAKENIFHRGFGKNTGFGLYLIQEILNITGISIRETGTEGKGARFEIVVPEGEWRLG